MSPPPPRRPRPRRLQPGAAVAVLAAAGLAPPVQAATLAPVQIPAQDEVHAERRALQARVATVRAALQAAGPTACEGAAWALAQATNWTNWPKWSKWSNWANK